MPTVGGEEVPFKANSISLRIQSFAADKVAISLREMSSVRQRSERLPLYESSHSMRSE